MKSGYKEEDILILKTPDHGKIRWFKEGIKNEEFWLCFTENKNILSLLVNDGCAKPNL